MAKKNIRTADATLNDGGDAAHENDASEQTESSARVRRTTTEPKEATDVVAATAAIAGVPAAEPAPQPKKKQGKKSKTDASLADVFAGYLRSLETGGKSEGTVISYRMELVLAGNALGIDSPIADITPERVLSFFVSDAVTTTRSGRTKSPLSIDKTRRVLRQALVWAETVGMVAKAPLPEDVASH